MFAFDVCVVCCVCFVVLCVGGVVLGVLRFRLCLRSCCVGVCVFVLRGVAVLLCVCFGV